MRNIDLDHELAAVEGGMVWPDPGCNPFPWPPFPGPIWDLGTTDCWPGPIIY